MSSIAVVTPPVIEPVTVAEAKAFSRFDNSSQDDLFAGLISAAREYCETFTRRAFITTSFRQGLNRFPHLPYYGLQGVSYPHRDINSEIVFARQIKLYRPPLISVSKIEYKDAQGQLQTLNPFDASGNPTGFLVDADDEPACIYPVSGTSWPVSYQIVPNNVKIFFDAGYGDIADKVPQGIKTAIKQLVAHWFEHRESVTEDRLQEVPQAVDMLLTMYRVLDFAPTQD